MHLDENLGYQMATPKKPIRVRGGKANTGDCSVSARWEPVTAECLDQSGIRLHGMPGEPLQRHSDGRVGGDSSAKTRRNGGAGAMGTLARIDS